MKVDRITRVNALLKREIGDLLFRVMKEASFDLSAVTVTHVSTGRDLRDATVHVSIRDHEKERDRMLALLDKHRGEMQRQINKNIGLKYTPRLAFKLDTSLERGDHILGLLAEMERTEQEEGEDHPAS